jgi:hypothetical protein
MAARLSALRYGRTLSPRKIFMLICVTGWANPRVIVLMDGLGKVKKKCNDIGIRTRDFQGCSRVLQPTTLLCAPAGGLVPYKLQGERNSVLDYTCKILQHAQFKDLCSCSLIVSEIRVQSLFKAYCYKMFLKLTCPLLRASSHVGAFVSVSSFTLKTLTSNFHL